MGCPRPNPAGLPAVLAGSSLGTLLLESDSNGIRDSRDFEM